MKLYCKGRYRNDPAGLRFDEAGVVEVDDWQAEFLLRDAPENFNVIEAGVAVIAPAAAALDEAPADKQIKNAPRKK